MNITVLKYTTIAGLSFFTAIFLYLSYLYPITADLWYFIGSENNSPIDFYMHTYQYGNPRIGEVLLYLGGNTHTNIAIANLAGLIVFSCAAFCCATGRLYPTLSLQDIIVFLVPAIAIGWSLPESGTLFFYLPFNANYVFSFGLLLLFIATLRLSILNEKNYALPLLLPLGLIAGLSNEHTVPALITVMLLLMITSKIKKWKYNCNYYLIGLLSLTIGYCFLFFAPGQSVRYPVKKFSALSQPIMDIYFKIIDLYLQLFTNAWIIILLILVSFIFLLRKNHVTFSLKIVVLSFCLLSIGITGTIVASPEVGPRLYFSAFASLSIALAAILDKILYKETYLTLFAFFACTILISLYFWVGYYWISAANNEYLERVNIALTQDAEGITPVIIPPSSLDYTKAGFFIFSDVAFENTDPTSVRNQQYARAFGVKSVIVRK